MADSAAVVEGDLFAVVVPEPGKRVLLIHISAHDCVFLLGHHGCRFFGRGSVGLLFLLRAAPARQQYGRGNEDTSRVSVHEHLLLSSLYTTTVDCVATEFTVDPALE